MQYDVFISYSSVDQKIAEGVCAYLEQHGIRCFVAYRDIARGVVWAGAIVEALERSRMMLVLFSKHFNNSKQVDREIELAAEQGMPILTFRLSNEDFTGAKKYYLKNLNWIDAFPNPQKYFGSLKENVSRLLGEKGSSNNQLISQSTHERCIFYDIEGDKIKVSSHKSLLLIPTGNMDDEYKSKRNKEKKIILLLMLIVIIGCVIYDLVLMKG